MYKIIHFTSGSVTEEPYFSISYEIESIPSVLSILSLDSPFLTSLYVNGKSRTCDVELSDTKEVIVFHHKNSVHYHLVYVMFQNIVSNQIIRYRFHFTSVFVRTFHVI